MKKPSTRFVLQTGGAVALLSIPFFVLAQTPPAPAPAAAAAPGAAAPAAAPAAPAVPSAADGGYLIGLSFGEQIRRIGITNEVSADDVTRGLKDALAGKKLLPADQQQLQLFVKSTIDAVTARNKAAGRRSSLITARKKASRRQPPASSTRFSCPEKPKPHRRSRPTPSRCNTADP
jgi:hypothetical protein